MKSFLVRSFVRVFLPLLLALTVADGHSKQSAQKPNVIVLIADDLGVGDLGFSGAKDVPTPHIDRLASEGVIFNNGYVYPMCAPTRAAFLTGRNPAMIGFLDNRPGDSRHFGMDLGSKTVADVLKQHGYVTALIGKWHTGRGLNNEYSPWNRGFDEFLGYYGAFGVYENPKLTRPPGTEQVIEGYSTDIFANAACEFMERNRDKPFFLNVTFNAAHLKQVAKPEDLARFTHIQDPKRRTAAAIISNLDMNIGRIAEQMKKLGIDRNTLLFFFSDNGGEPPVLATMNGPYRGMKFDLYEGGIRVPFFARWPAGMPKGKTLEPLVAAEDLLPTIAAAVGAKVPNEVDGENLLPYLRGDTKKMPRESLFWRTTDHAALQRMRRQPKGKPPVYIPYLSAMRQGKWKLVVFDDAGKDRRAELYDMDKDPSEKNDLANKEKKVVERMSRELDAWRSTTKDQVIPRLPLN